MKSGRRQYQSSQHAENAHQTGSVLQRRSRKMSIPFAGPVIPKAGVLTSIRGNSIGISLLRVMSKRWKRMATKAKTCSLAILRPGQRLTPPPKGRYDECWRRSLFPVNRFASKSWQFAPYMFSLKWSCRLDMRILAPGLNYLFPMQVGVSTLRPIMAPALRRRHS